MLFDLGMSELLLIGVVALVVIGPKDLPKALRVAGYWVRKARTLSREFQSSVEQMIREAELDEMRQQLKKATEIDFEHEFRQTIDPTGSLAESLKPPELPKLFEAEPPGATPASGLRSEPPVETAMAEPAAPAATPPREAPAPPRQAAAAAQDNMITPAQAPGQGDRPSPAAAGSPLSRE
jgi:sec-independent protein translocase protein TatB